MTSTSPASDDTDFRYRYLHNNSDTTPTVKRNCGARRRVSMTGCPALWEYTTPGCTCCSTLGRLELGVTPLRGGYAAFHRTLDSFRSFVIHLYNKHIAKEARLCEAECEHIGFSSILLSVFNLGTLGKAELGMITQLYSYKLGILCKGHVLIIVLWETDQNFGIWAFSFQIVLYR